MNTTLAETPDTRVHFPTAGLGYDPAEYLVDLAFALEESGVTLEFQELGERDADRKRTGTPWREHSPRELWAAAGRRRRYLQRVNRRVGSLLPPAFKSLALRYVLTEPDAMMELIYESLEFEPASQPITKRAHVDRLLRIVGDRLAGRPANAADQKHLERTLRQLNARNVLLRARADPAAPQLPIGAAVSCNATSAALGSYQIVASSALMPGAGHVVGRDGEDVLVDPRDA